MNEANTKIAAVIVTHNRFALLQEAIQAVLDQDFPTNNIVVVNNGSTDGSTEWLKQQQGLHCIHQANLGCSAGFSAGIKKAYQLGAEWIWVMDDDSIASPTALRQLIDAVHTIGDDRTGFICSRVEWTDGSPHLMNIPHINIFDKLGNPFNKYEKEGALLVNSCSFVSLLVNVKSVAVCGLPYRDFFIWGDDMEFTKRIIQAGFLGFYAPGSIVVHKTATNYSADIFNDDDKSIWKYKYGIRNNLFVIRKNKGRFKFLIVVLKQ
ncbi:MAG: glycosyltransferase family 2 protein, partial [Ferruginibacter sp.]